MYCYCCVIETDAIQIRMNSSIPATAVTDHLLFIVTVYMIPADVCHFVTICECVVAIFCPCVVGLLCLLSDSPQGICCLLWI